MAQDAMFPLLLADSRFVPDVVGCPEVHYGENGAFLDYLRQDEGWARVVFDRFDSLRICRGEHAPYPSTTPEHYFMFGYVRPSSWVQERFAYENAHYGKSYEFGSDVGEMLHEFEHYVFMFHDQFVEVVAGGVHFDASDSQHVGTELFQRPAWAKLSESSTIRRWDCSGLVFQVRSEERDEADIIEASVLCDQSIYQFALEFEGRASVGHALHVRTRDGVTRSRLRGYFGNTQREFEGVPSLDELRPFFEEHAAEVRARRVAMGKDSDGDA
jgi:hypothetical protein